MSSTNLSTVKSGNVNSLYVHLGFDVKTFTKPYYASKAPQIAPQLLFIRRFKNFKTLNNILSVHTTQSLQGWLDAGLYFFIQILRPNLQFEVVLRINWCCSVICDLMLSLLVVKQHRHKKSFELSFKTENGYVYLSRIYSS